MLTRRTQILLDEERHERLSREADATGASIAALIRDAIDRTYPVESPRRRRAAAEFLRLIREDEETEGQQEDWQTLKPRIRDEMAKLERYPR